MAHFAQLDENNLVTQVIVLSNAVVGEQFPESESVGVSFIAEQLRLPGVWVQTSYNGTFRKQYAGIGYTFDSGVFIAPQPYPSWSLDDNHDWQPPVPRPEGDYLWNEDDQEWQEIPTN